jgi:hypothetical protein
MGGTGSWKIGIGKIEIGEKPFHWSVLLSFDLL